MSAIILIALVTWVLIFIFSPVVAASIGILAIALFILRAGIIGLRNGYVSINARTKFVTYDRSINPIEFWFYVIVSIAYGQESCTLDIKGSGQCYYIVFDLMP